MASAKKGGEKVGVTKKGKGTKWLLVVDGNGLPLGFHLDSANMAEVKLAEQALDTSGVARSRGRPKRRPEKLVADRAYDSSAFRRTLRRRGIYVGIDVAKAQLDIAVRPGGEQWKAPNDEVGITTLVARVQALRHTLVVLEATGGREVPVAIDLATAGLAVAVVNPRQVRDFARAIGQLAKTDALDAQLLAHFAAVVRPAPVRSPTPRPRTSARC